MTEQKRPVGPPRIFLTPEDLWSAFEEYREHVRGDPFQEEKVFHGKGGIARAKVDKLRPLTQIGFRLHAGFSRKCWSLWRATRPDLHAAMDDIEDAIYDQKFGAAAAGFLKENLIARELGLADRIKAQTVVEQTGPQLDPLDIPDKVHPDDPDPYAEKPLLFSQRQLDAGVPFPKASN